jgi:hypothetical protein
VNSGTGSKMEAGIVWVLACAFRSRCICLSCRCAAKASSPKKIHADIRNSGRCRSTKCRTASRMRAHLPRFSCAKESGLCVNPFTSMRTRQGKCARAPTPLFQWKFSAEPALYIRRNKSTDCPPEPRDFLDKLGT